MEIEDGNGRFFRELQGGALQPFRDTPASCRAPGDFRHFHQSRFGCVAICLEGVAQPSDQQFPPLSSQIRPKKVLANSWQELVHVDRLRRHPICEISVLGQQDCDCSEKSLAAHLRCRSGQQKRHW